MPEDGDQREIIDSYVHSIQWSRRFISFISFISACQQLGRIYNLTEDFQVNKVTEMARLNTESP